MMPNSREHAAAVCVVIARLLAIASWGLLGVALARWIRGFDRAVYVEFLVASIVAAVLLAAGISLGKRYSRAWMLFDVAAVALMIVFVLIVGVKF